MARTTSAALAGFVVAIGAFGFGCRFEPGKPFSWSSTIRTQFAIGDGEDRQIGYYHFNDPFELSSGDVSLRMNYKADQAAGPLTPSALTLRLSLYDSTFSTMRFQYDLRTEGKMKQAGCCAYKVSFKGKDDGFSAWNVAAGDNLVWSVAPEGGILPNDVAIALRYTYKPN